MQTSNIESVNSDFRGYTFNCENMNFLRSLEFFETIFKALCHIYNRFLKIKINFQILKMLFNKIYIKPTNVALLFNYFIL